jgi:hypothetical protein
MLTLTKEFKGISPETINDSLTNYLMDCLGYSGADLLFFGEPLEIMAELLDLVENQTECLEFLKADIYL